MENDEINIINTHNFYPKYDYNYIIIMYYIV